MYGYNCVSFLGVFPQRNNEKKQPIVKLTEKFVIGSCGVVELLCGAVAMDTENQDGAEVLVPLASQSASQSASQPARVV